MSVLNKVDSGEMDNDGRLSRHVFTTSSAWYYLKDFCKNVVLMQHYYSSHKKRNIKHGMTDFSFKSKTLYHLLRFDNNPKCRILQDLLGRMVFVGLQRLMRYKDGHAVVHLNDMTNIVLCDSASYTTSKACSVEQTPNAPGIDLLFGEKGTLVKTRCNF
jgi:hypothetical protein